MSPQVNTPTADLPGDDAVAAEREQRPLEGRLSRCRTGPVRALQLVTGLALLRWLGLAVMHLLGYRHEASLRLSGGTLELLGRRRFLGLDLGRSQVLLPLGRLRRVVLVSRSRAGLLVAAVGLLLGCTAVGTTLVMWGMAGHQLSWVMLGACIIGLGVLLDAAAYLVVRRALARGQATLELAGGGLRLRLARVPAVQAEELVRALQTSLDQ
jgi:hypothetical protein